MYNFCFYIIKLVQKIINGKIKVYGLNNIPPKEKIILVAPHRTWWDPIIFAIILLPKKFLFMGKKELFKNKLFGSILKKIGVFPVNRKRPGPSAIKIPVRELRNNRKNFIIFPSGSRHSKKLEPGVAVIAKMSGKKIIPVIYQGPLVFNKLFKRKNIKVRFGSPIKINKKEKNSIILSKINDDFNYLDKITNPNWKYIDPHPNIKK